MQRDDQNVAPPIAGVESCPFSVIQQLKAPTARFVLTNFPHLLTRWSDKQRGERGFQGLIGSLKKEPAVKRVPFLSIRGSLFESAPLSIKVTFLRFLRPLHGFYLVIGYSGRSVRKEGHPVNSENGLMRIEGIISNG